MAGKNHLIHSIQNHVLSPEDTHNLEHIKTCGTKEKHSGDEGRDNKMDQNRQGSYTDQ